MNRSGYSDDFDEWSLIRWRGAVASAFKGKRGQAFLRELLAALDALPEKRLIAEDLMNEQGEVCAIGAVCKARGIDTTLIDPYCRETVAAAVGIAPAMAAEISYENDEWGDVTPTGRYARMHKWIESEIREVKPEKETP